MYDVIILGSGPAGLTAAIYTQRFGLSTLLIAGRKWGGQLMYTTDVENFPGFAHILGPELMQKMRDQVAGLGVEILDVDFTRLIPAKADSGNLGDSRNHTVHAEDQVLVGKTVIVATGADTRWLGVPNEERLRGHGVSSCAPCDAFFFRGKPVAVVGGGDSAMEEAAVIAKVSPDVVVIHRKESFRAQKVMIDRVAALKNVRFLFNTKVVEILGEDTLTGLLLEKNDGTREVLPREGVFVAIGLDPNTSRFEGVELDSHGYVKRFEEKTETGLTVYATKTNIPGVFTCGDVHDARYKQAVTAAAFGCMAALDVQKWLTENG